jgi:predicted amidohydrolase
MGPVPILGPMRTAGTVCVAAIQASPMILDAGASVDKVVALLGEAAALGADLAVLPECFVSLYPEAHWGNADPALWERFYANSVEVPGPLVDRLVDACRTQGIHAVIGVNEREADRSGSVYNTMLILGPDGLLGRHRKLMPTFHERSWHAFGAGDDLDVVATPFARLGGLICWENRMPLARYAVYRGHPQIWVAPTADTSPGWQSLMGAIAIESGAFVVASCQYQPHTAYPADFPVALVDEDATGGSAIFEPSEGQAIAGPLNGQEGIVIADCDLSIGTREKRWFDVVGHYSREDVLLPRLMRSGR